MTLEFESTAFETELGTWPGPKSRDGGSGMDLVFKVPIFAIGSRCEDTGLQCIRGDIL